MLLLALSFYFLLGQDISEKPQPNVLFIVVDDLRPDLKCYGNELIHSPNIDALAGSGTLFQQAYCQQPLCSPSRSSVMTGLRPDSCGVTNLNDHFRKTVPDVITLPQHFIKHGYRAEGIGKIYHSKKPLQDPPSWSAPWQAVRTPTWADPEVSRKIEETRDINKNQLTKFDQKKRYRGPPVEAAEVPDNTYRDGRITELALARLKDLKEQETPFFLAVGYVKPHLPFAAPKKYWDLYDRSQLKTMLPLEPPPATPKYALPDWKELRGYENIPEKGPVSKEKALELIHGYYACVSYIDAQVGMLMQALQELELKQNTIVVLWSDHGYKLGEYGSWGKNTAYEVDARVPLIVRAPGVGTIGQISHSLVELVDLYPTLCELAGLPAPVGLEGTSFVPLLQDSGRPWKSAVFWQKQSHYKENNQIWMVGSYSVRTEKYQYTQWHYRGDPDNRLAEELYDLEADPMETQNLAGSEEHSAKIEELRTQLHAGWTQAGPDTQ